MPVFNLGPLGRFKLSRTKSTNTTASQPPEQARSHTPPPAYTVNDESKTPPDAQSLFEKHRVPPQAQPPSCKKKQLRRYLLEIIALTFAANFNALNSAIHGLPISSSTTRILCDNERTYLLALSALVHKVHGQLPRREITSVALEDEETLYLHIVQPGEEFDIQLGR
jgi:hypothetical protein